ncbi:MAG: rhodanese-like domain-containing protein [Actinomycetales bacterium]
MSAVSAPTHDIHPAVDRDHVREMPARVGPAALREWLSSPDRPQLIDVRSAAEFRAAHIPSAYNVPLSLLKEHRSEFIEPLSQQIVLVCRTDRRAGLAEEALAGVGLSRVHVLEGGMTAWQREAHPVTEGTGRWDLERQVRLVAGGLVASGVLASVAVPRAKWLAGAIGAGLMTAALTDSCLMGSLLSKLPYNRDVEPDLSRVLDTLATA